jgi:hypothetical protein
MTNPLISPGITERINEIKFGHSEETDYPVLKCRLKGSFLFPLLWSYCGHGCGILMGSAPQGSRERKV